jgi:hypothetical protein
MRAIASLLLAVVLAAGCSSSAKGHKAGPHSSAPSSRSSSAPFPSQRAPAKPPVNKPALRKYIAVSGCRSTSTGWAASGTARNPSGDARTYKITVFFTSNPGNTVINYATTRVPVQAGKTVKWQAAASFKGTPTMHCVLDAVS